MEQKVSVILPIYNGADTLSEALDSVLSQSDIDFKIIAIDDGSSDDSWQILGNYNSPNLIKINQANKGLSATLNVGIEKSYTPYIARQDQDDIVLPKRLIKQIRFLEDNPSIAMVGTWAQIASLKKRNNNYHRHPISTDTLRFELLFNNPFVHSSMMIRAGILREFSGYSEDKLRQPPEDYELWSRIARKYEIANLPEVLTIYREVPGSMSRNTNSPFLNNILKISSENIHFYLGKYFSIEDCKKLSELYHKDINSKDSMPINKALMMLRIAAEKIAGNEKNWNQEFKLSFRRKKRYLILRKLRSYMPFFIIQIIKLLKQKIYK